MREILETPLPLYVWLNTTHPDANAYGAKSALGQVELFSKLNALANIRVQPSDLPEEEDRAIRESHYKMREDAARVVSQHRSKSIILPVVEVSPPEKGISFTLRGNFYNWKVSVEADRELELDPLMLFQEEPPEFPKYSGNDLASCYFEGFPTDRIYGYYAQDKKKFSVNLWSDEDLYVFFFECMRAYERPLWLKNQEASRECTARAALKAGYVKGA